MKTRTFIASATTLLVLGTSAGAWGQPLPDSLALQVFDPSAAGDRFLSTPDPFVQGHLEPRAKLTASYGYRPLRLLDADTGDPLTNGTLVRHQLYFHLDASLALWNRLQVNLGLPFAAYQSGDTLTPGTDAVKSARLADMRLGLRARLWGEAQEPIALGFQADVWLPTGSKANYAGDGMARLHGRLLAGGLLADSYVYAVSAGFLLRESKDLWSQELGNAVTYSAGVAGLLDEGRLQVGPELYGSTTIASGTSPIEAIVGARYRLGPVNLGAGVGTALSDAVGSVPLRVLLAVGYEPMPIVDRDGDGVPDKQDACPMVAGERSSDPAKNGCPPERDRDGDGVLDSQDACPDVPGERSIDKRKNGCPVERDRDGDGIVDKQDACPDVPGTASDDPAKNGCPPDRDGDGVIDKEDACPEVAGVTSSDPAKNGCPPDRDGDGILDKDDACPDVAGVKSEDPQKHGCPPAAEIKGDQIVILEQVQFDTNKATIKPASDSILQAVAAIMREHTEITRIAVEGHTDNVGKRGKNLKLSANRAKAVKTWLVKQGGIAASRLTTAGLGPDRPIADNESEEGRQKNRRVEFHIQKP